MAAFSEIRTVSKVIALVTGGASGLGRATVERLSRQGASVIIADLPGSNGDNIAKEIGGNTVYVPTDVCTFMRVDLHMYVDWCMSLLMNHDLPLDCHILHVVGSLYFSYTQSSLVHVDNCIW